MTARVGGANWDPHEPEGADNLERSYGVHDTPWGPRSLTLLSAARARGLGVDAGSACIPPHDQGVEGWAIHKSEVLGVVTTGVVSISPSLGE